MWVEIVVVLAVILCSMVLHELAHGVVAYALGDTTAKDDGRLTLNPLKHLDPVMSIAMPLLLLISGAPIFGGAKPVPVNTHRLKHGAVGMALVGIAGPLTNFILAFLSYVIGVLTGNLQMSDGGLYYSTGTLGLVFVEFVMVNLGFGVFNLIPIPPLDGSRVLYALMPDPVRELMERIEPMGIMIVMVLVVMGSGLLSGAMMSAVNGILNLFHYLV